MLRVTLFLLVLLACAVPASGQATDGIEIASRALGPSLAHGAMVAMNGGPRIFLIFRWPDVAAGVKPELRQRNESSSGGRQAAVTRSRPENGRP
jgi:hypothetical protein